VKPAQEPATRARAAKKASSASQSNRRSKVKNLATSQHSEGSGPEADDSDKDATTPLIEDKRWTDTFLPSLTHKLFTAHHTFLDFQVDSKAFLKNVQEVFEVAYPNIEYTLKRTDSLVITVRS
jgi:hypothetical protein